MGRLTVRLSGGSVTAAGMAASGSEGGGAWAAEQGLRREREARNRARRHGHGAVPCADPARGPTLREAMVYLDERQKLAAGAAAARPLPASAFAAGAGDDGGDIIDVPRAGAGSWAGAAADPGEVDRLAVERAARRLGLPAGQTGRMEDPRAHESIKALRERVGPPVREYFEPPKLPDNIAKANGAHTCAQCHFAGTRYRCSRCKVARYCSASCMKRHWATHKAECRKAPAADDLD